VDEEGGRGKKNMREEVEGHNKLERTHKLLIREKGAIRTYRGNWQGHILENRRSITSRNRRSACYRV